MSNSNELIEEAQLEIIGVDLKETHESPFCSAPIS
jgi:hypothetical protein